MHHKLDQLKTRPGDIKVVELPRRRRVLWTVDLHVGGRQVDTAYVWHGFAVDSIEASDLAIRDFYGPLLDDLAVRQRFPVRVVKIIQEGV